LWFDDLLFLDSVFVICICFRIKVSGYLVGFKADAHAIWIAVNDSREILQETAPRLVDSICAYRGGYIAEVSFFSGLKSNQNIDLVKDQNDGIYILENKRRGTKVRNCYWKFGYLIEPVAWVNESKWVWLFGLGSCCWKDLYPLTPSAYYCIFLSWLPFVLYF